MSQTLQTLSRLFLVGAFNRQRKRKRTNRENPRTNRENHERIEKVPEHTKKGQIGTDESISGNTVDDKNARKSRVQEDSRDRSRIIRPSLIAPKHSKTVSELSYH